MEMKRNIWGLSRTKSQKKRDNNCVREKEREKKKVSSASKKEN